MNLSRLRYHPDSQLFLYEPKAGQEADEEPLVDPLEFLARVLIHIPEPHKHLVHFYRAYANRVRATYRAEDTAPPKTDGEAVATAPKWSLSKRWAELIYRIYQVDPLTCPRCRARMKILTFILDPKVIRQILHHLDKNQSSTRIESCTIATPTIPIDAWPLPPGHPSSFPLPFSALFSSPTRLLRPRPSFELPAGQLDLRSIPATAPIQFPTVTGWSG